MKGRKQILEDITALLYSRPTEAQMDLLSRRMDWLRRVHPKQRFSAKKTALFRR